MIFDALFMLLFILLGVLFLGLKLGGAIRWPWVLVLLPWPGVLIAPVLWEMGPGAETGLATIAIIAGGAILLLGVIWAAHHTSESECARRRHLASRKGT